MLGEPSAPMPKGLLCVVFHSISSDDYLSPVSARLTNSIVTKQSHRFLFREIFTKLSMGAESSAAPRGSMLIRFLQQGV
jgi:hypothetical protein